MAGLPAEAGHAIRCASRNRPRNVAVASTRVTCHGPTAPQPTRSTAPRAASARRARRSPTPLGHSQAPPIPGALPLVRLTIMRWCKSPSPPGIASLHPDERRHGAPHPLRPRSLRFLAPDPGDRQVLSQGPEGLRRGRRHDGQCNRTLWHNKEFINFAFWSSLYYLAETFSSNKDFTKIPLLITSISLRDPAHSAPDGRPAGVPAASGICAPPPLSEGH